MKRLSWTIAAAIGLASPAFAHATGAYVITEVDMLSGPDQDYPQIDRLEEGSEVDVQGCTEEWEWCDVIAYGERGWVPGAALQVEYENQWVPMPDYADYYRVPIVVFSINNYWDSYYRYRPFYYQRWNWYRWHPPHRQRPYPVDFPRPHPFPHGPPVHHRPNPRPYPVDPPGHGRPLPHPVDPPGHGRPLPYPVDPPGHVRPLPYPVDPPGHGRPLPHPVDPPGHGRPMPRPVDPARVMPMPHPVPAQPAKPANPPKQSPKDKDPVEQGQRKQ